MHIIDNYRQLTLGMYSEILAINKEDLPDIDRQVRILSVLTGATEEELLDLPIAEYSNLARKATFLKRPLEDLQTKVAHKYICGDFELVPTKDLRSITTAQYIDYKTLAEKEDGDIAEKLGCILIPKGKKYNKGYDILEVHEAIRADMSVADALTLCAFFLTKYTDLIKASLISSIRAVRRMPQSKEKEMMQEKLNHLRMYLETSGDGLRA